MSINTNYSLLTRAVQQIQNPNKPLGTLLEEIPCDIGRSVQGYKRGGAIEGAEKLRKEVMGAVVWLFGMPAFKKLGDTFCEKILKIPMDIDFSITKAGNNAVSDSVNYLLTGSNPKNLDVSDLAKYAKNTKLMEKLKAYPVDKLVKRISGAKKATSLMALVLNCIAMGVVLPRINQKLTRDKLNEQKENLKITKLFDNFATFKEKTSNKNSNKNISFTGLKTGLTDFFAYNVENNNIFRLCATDIPMSIGHAVTSRNKYEALENSILDIVSIYFYNFSSTQIQKLLRNRFKVPDISPAIVELIKNAPEEILNGALDEISNVPKEGTERLRNVIKDNSLVDKIYKEATYGKYGKINKFVKNEDMKSIDNSVLNFINVIKSKCAKNGTIDKIELEKLAKSVNNKNAKFLAVGLVSSIFGLAVLVPKLAFWVTKKLTGRNEFSGIADYSDLENKKA